MGRRGEDEMGPDGGALAWAIGRMRRAELDAVAAIERRSYAAPWGREVFAGELERDVARIDVIREREHGGERVIAYCNYWLVCDEIHLLNIATDPEYRGRGCARRLLDHLTALGERRGSRFITLEVRRSNTRARELYRRHGFFVVGTRRAYYPDGEDAMVMRRRLGGAGDRL